MESTGLKGRVSRLGTLRRIATFAGPFASSRHAASRFFVRVQEYVGMFAVASVLAVVSAGATAAELTWKGGFGAPWSDPANWDPAQAPTTGDTLVFNALGLDVGQNNLDGVILASVRASGINHFIGAPIVVSGGVDACYATFTTSIVLTQDGTICAHTLRGGLDAGALNVNLQVGYVEGPISGSGTITSDASPTLSGPHGFRGLFNVTGLKLANADLPEASVVASSIVSGSGYVKSIDARALHAAGLEVDTLLLSANATLIVHLGQPLVVYHRLRLGGTPDMRSENLPILRGQSFPYLRYHGVAPIEGAFLRTDVFDAGGHARGVLLPAGDGDDLDVRITHGEAIGKDDLDTDGRSEILWHNAGAGAIHRLRMNGLVLQAQGTFYHQASSPWDVLGTGNFDGIPSSDVVLRNAVTGQVDVLHTYLGPSVLSRRTLHTEPDPHWRIVGIGDLDGDGYSDLLWWNDTTGLVWAILFKDWGIKAQFAVYQEGNTQWRPVALGDFQRSGRQNQLIWRHAATGQVYQQTITVSGGVAAVGGAHIYAEPNPAWVIVGTPDLDGDGRSDLLWFNTSTKTAYGMLMNGDTIVSQGFIHDADGNWNLVATGDYNGDGKDDLLWRNSVDGRVWMMLMNGLGIATQGQVYQEPNAAWEVVP